MPRANTRAVARAPRFIALSAVAIAPAILLAACGVSEAPPRTAGQAALREAFRRDRERCQAVAERTIPYVNPRDGDAVATRSYRVEGEIQGCMLARGWNNPEFDGWKDGGR